MNLADIKKLKRCADTTLAATSLFPGFQIKINHYSLRSTYHVLRLISAQAEIEMWFTGHEKYSDCKFYFALTRSRGYSIVLAHAIYGNSNEMISHDCGIDNILIKVTPDSHTLRRIHFDFSGDIYELADSSSNNVLSLYRSFANIALSQPNYCCNNQQYISAFLNWRGIYSES